MHSLELLLLSVSIHSYIHKYTYLLHVWSEMYLSFLVLAKMTKTSTKNTVDIKSASEKNPLHKCVTTQLTLVAATQGLLKKFTYSFRKTYVASRLTCSEQRALHQRNWGRDLDNLFAWLLGGLVNLSIESPLRNDYENHACVFIYIVANQCKAQDGTLIWTLSTTQGRKSQTSSFGENFWNQNCSWTNRGKFGLQCSVLEFPSYRICWSNRICMLSFQLARWEKKMKTPTVATASSIPHGHLGFLSENA